MSSLSYQPDVDATSPQSSLIQAIEKHWQPSKQPLMELTPYSPRPQAVSDESLTVTQNIRSQSSPRKFWNFKRSWSFKERWYAFVRGLGLALYWILRVFWYILCGIGIVALVWLVGNGILRAAHLPGYTSNAVAASVGAVGAIFAGMIVGTVLSCLPCSDSEDPPWYIKVVATVLTATLAGVLGFKILDKHIDMKGLDLLHATRAGALGGTIMGPGAIIVLPLVIGLILSPLLIVVMAGGEWIYAKSTENWGPNSHSYCYCVCYGSRGDPEIEAEVERIQNMERRHRYERSTMFDNSYHDHFAITRY
ncbi:hypothetical protein H1R20_g3759, partial [Candolleomyces eurysporus]